MLRFISHLFDGSDGMALWPTIGFVLFFSMFLAVLWWVFTVDRRHLEHLAATPLDDNTPKDRHEA
jgi:cbb3-type cytochrome oxidase subunit 3